MPILQHLEELRQRILKILWTVFPLFVFYVTFTIRLGDVGGIRLPYPWPDFYSSVSVQVVQLMMRWYLPGFVTPVQLSPAEAILVQFKVAIFLSILTGMPMIVYQLAKFVSPGLLEQERRVIAKITIPASLLFLGGVLISHFVILPFAFQFLYGIGLRMGLTPFVGPDQFFDVVLFFFVGMGLAFQTPIIMWGLTVMGIVEPSIYAKYWRVAVVAFFVFGAIITPDGSGITMVLVAAPMTGLYAVGYLMAKRTWEERERGPRVERPEGRRSRLALWSVVVILLAATAGGVVYYNMPLFQPPTGVSSQVLAEGVTTLELPAFVLYSAMSPSPSIHSGSQLIATNATEVRYTWSALSSDGLDIIFEGSGEVTTMDVVENGTTIVTRPATWTSPETRSLTLTVTDGESGVYLLRMDLSYRLVLRQAFTDANRNGVLDSGETVLRAWYMLTYTATPVSASFVAFEETWLRGPANQDLELLDQGIFAAVGAGWRLSATSDLLPENGTYSYEFEALDISLGGQTLKVFLTRSFQWSESTFQEVWAEGSGSTDLEYRWYVDLRFGVLFPQLLPA